MEFSGRVKAVAIAAVVVCAAAAGTVYAAETGGTITVCVHEQGGGLYRASQCAAHDSKLTWNIQGPKGSQGKAGPSAAYASYHDAAVAVSSTSFAQIGKLNVPSGNLRRVREVVGVQHWCVRRASGLRATWRCGQRRYEGDAVAVRGCRCRRADVEHGRSRLHVRRHVHALVRDLERDSRLQ